MKIGTRYVSTEEILGDFNREALKIRIQNNTRGPTDEIKEGEERIRVLPYELKQRFKAIMNFAEKVQRERATLNGCIDQCDVKSLLRTFDENKYAFLVEPMINREKLLLFTNAFWLDVKRICNKKFARKILSRKYNLRVASGWIVVLSPKNITLNSN